MEKIIEVDIIDEFDLYEKYNRKHISRDLINYLIETTPHFTKKDKIKIVITNNLEEVCTPLIIDGLQREYNKSMLRNHRNNWIQVIYLLIGIFILFLSTLIKETVSKEIVLIIGWVFIWAMIEVQIFTDVKGMKKRRILKKLLQGEIIEKKLDRNI